MTSSDGDVTVVVPPDLGQLALPHGVFAQGPMVGDNPSLEIWVAGPRDAQPQPRGAEPLRGWLEAGAWIPSLGDGGISSIGEESEGAEWLPAGRAYRVAMTAFPGTPDATRVIGYAIATEDGFAVLRIVGAPDVVRARADELRLIALLVHFAAE